MLFKSIKVKPKKENNHKLLLSPVQLFANNPPDCLRPCAVRQQRPANNLRTRYTLLLSQSLNQLHHARRQVIAPLLPLGRAIATWLHAALKKVGIAYTAPAAAFSSDGNRLTGLKAPHAGLMLSASAGFAICGKNFL